MMRRSVVYPILFLAALGAAGTSVRAQTGDVAVTNLSGQSRFTADQLDNLTGPVALYPDALLAQVLVASTFPDQVSDAAAFVRTNGTSNIDNQSWDISVKAVAHYPSALNAMADKIDWTTALGQAYASQSSEVMQSVQRLRAMASANGNLNTTQQQQVIQQGTTYEIVPVQPQVIYVPVYDPYVIYSRPIFNVGFSSRYWSFGVGFPIGSWLSYDCDWGTQRVYYNGWAPEYYGYSGNWRLRSQPFIRVSDIYVSPRYRNVYVNRTVVTHVVDYRNVDRYASVHGGAHFEGRYDNYHRDGRGNNGNDHSPVRGGVAQNGGGYRGLRDANGRPNNDGNPNGRGGNRPDNNNTPRTAVPQQRRNEPAQRTDGQQPQVVAPTHTGDRGNNNGQYQIQRQGQQRQAQPLPQPQQPQMQPQQHQAQPQPQPQQPQVQHQPQPQQPQVQHPQQPQAQPRVAQPRQPQGAPHVEQHARPAEARPEHGRGGEGNDSSRHHGH